MPEDQSAAAAARLQQAIDALTRAFEDALALVDASIREGDRQEALDLAVTLFEAIEAKYHQTAKRRKAAIRRVWDEEKPSVRQMARRARMSTTRAHQLKPGGQKEEP
jgi:hypothetical protein